MSTLKRENNFSFLCVADSKFFFPLKVSVSQAKKFYPENRFIIYDWGLSDEQRSELLSYNTVVIRDWDFRYADLHFKLSIRKTLEYLLNARTVKQLVSNVLKRPKSLFRSEHLFNLYAFGQKMYNKMLCVEDALAKSVDKLLIIDADAFLIGTLPEMIVDEFDLGVTVRRKDEFNFKYNECTVLNGGVVFLFGSHETNKIIVRDWLKEFVERTEIHNEQTALTRLIQKQLGESVFDTLGTTHRLTTSENTPFSVRLLSCDEYNFNWIEEYSDHPNKDAIKILHFKSGRFETPLFKKLMAELNIK